MWEVYIGFLFKSHNILGFWRQPIPYETQRASKQVWIGMGETYLGGVGPKRKT